MSTEETAPALLATVEQAARLRGCRELRLEVRIDNATAVRLYERLGYRCLGQAAPETCGSARLPVLRYRKTL